MSKSTDRVAFLKGLAAGMKLNTEKNSNKLILDILDLLGEMAADIDTLAEAHNELNDYVEAIDDDLSDMEQALYDDEDEDAYDPDEDEETETEEDEVISYACPHCGHEMTFKASEVDFDENYTCPECGKNIFPELANGEEDDGEIEEAVTENTEIENPEE